MTGGKTSLTVDCESPKRVDFQELSPLVPKAGLPKINSLRAFEEWYRERLTCCSASPAWAPSASGSAMQAMVQLWLAGNQIVNVDKSHIVELAERPPRRLLE